ncbi:hypothetical protein WR25_06910 [Diploscapter pachys]|uniref:CUB domain-containing protein n=1 Tax=Diploscapter pachys TaxID=2018661 RepID=A0A2A2L433_9BILA|nr:hypothetical protein WR25_06910 [Diploscapter pachys]
MISSALSMNSSSANHLKLREDSIFPHCNSEYTVGWETASCPSANLSYRLRVLALPEGNVNHEDRAVYIEETGLLNESNPLSISCSQFDIIFEKYCFELVSVNLNTSVFHLWQSTCVSTEPVHRQNGGFSAWGDWEECNVSCGQGKQRRVRYCDSPPPNSRGKDCVGEVMQIRKCVLRECPEAQSHNQLASSNCSCGCLLEGFSGTFFASPQNAPFCPQGNQTWSIMPRKNPMVVDFTVKKDTGAAGKLFFFIGAPYQELIWYADPSRDPAFTIALTRPLFIVLWNKNATAQDTKTPKGFTVTYHLRDPPSQMPIRYENNCNPFCSETLVICALGFIFLLIIFLPPIVCANITERMKRGSSPDMPLIDQKHENEMVRSGNTECTQVSGAAGNSQNGGRGLQTAGANYVAKRSIGIQLSVQNTPNTIPRINKRLTRACASVSAESPLLRGQSSLSASDELEYDYYDGTTIPGSLLAPPTQLLTAYGDMMTEIDIDQIIGQSELFTSNSNNPNRTPVQKADVQTQAGEMPNCTKI